MEVLRKYGVATTILFPLIDRGAVDFEATPVTFATGDTKIIKDEGAAANTGSNPAHEGNGIYSLALTATEMQAARIAITVIDSATKTWEDQAVLVATYGNASAQHALDLDTTVPTVSEIANQVWDELLSGHVVAGSFGEAGQTMQNGTAQAGGLLTITLASGASAVNDFYNGAMILIVAGTGVGQTRNIADYNGSTRIASLSAQWFTNPDATSQYVILPYAVGIQALLLANAISSQQFTAQAIDASALATDAVEEIADAVLKRPISNVESTGLRTLYGAIASLVNRAKINGTNLEIYETDDTTLIASIPITTDPNQQPVSELDPS